MVEPWTIVLTAVLGVLMIYRWCFQGLNYFGKRGVPYVPAVPIFGNMAPVIFRKKTLEDTLYEAYNHNKNARYIGFFDFLDPVVILRDPELMKSVTVKNFDYFPERKVVAGEVHDSLLKESLAGLQGQRWRDTRALLSPAFTSSKMKTLFKLVKDCASNLVSHLQELGKDSTVFEMRDFLTRYTNDGIVTSAFGISVNSLKDPDNDFFKIGREATDFSGGRSLRLFILRTYPRLSKFLDVKLWSRKISNFYKNVVKSTIAIRRANGIVRPDMLQLMMQASDKSQLKLSDDDMTAHAFVFYFGGFDTASVLIHFLVHEIAVHQKVREKLQAEVDEVFDKCNGDVTYEALHAMQYLDAVVNETLRLHTPATLVDRICRKQFELPPAEPGLKPFVVEPGVNVWMPASALHKDPKHYSNPEEFHPERFLGVNKGGMDSATFIPFGIGPRSCIGNRFALMEAKIVAFELMANFDIAPCSKTVNPLKLSLTSFVPRIDGGVWLNVQPRRRL